MQPLSEPAAGGARLAGLDLRALADTRPLISALAFDFSSVASLFSGNPADPGAWRSTIERVRRAPRDRARLAALLQAQLARRGTAAEARRAADRLASPDAAAVVTGQQTGLFGGPLYTLLKAVTAVQLARRVEDEHGVPTVAVFWAHGEDHDWQEVRTASVLDADAALAEVGLDAPPGAGDQPMHRLVLDAGIDRALDRLGAVLPQTEFTSELLARLRAHYRAGSSLSAAFAGWMDDLMARHGLVVFEGDDPDAKPLMADLLARELERADETTALVRAGAGRLRALGHAPPLEPADDAVAMFYLDARGRLPIRRRDGALGVGHERRAAADLAAEARAHPERFSPNVVLRPVTQDRLFPTICYVGGPSEIAYQAQLGGVYRAFGVEPPLLFPRTSATLIDAATERFLERSDLPLDALRARDEAALNGLLARHLPPSLDDALDATRRALDAHVEPLRAAAIRVDPTLGGAVETTTRRLHDTLETLHAKIVHAAKRKDATLRRQFARAQALAFPGGTPQERVLSVPFFVNRYGLTLAAQLLQVLPLGIGRHWIVRL